MNRSEYIKAGVIGDPVAHSLSPMIHNRWIAGYGLKGAYNAVRIGADELLPAARSLIDKDGYSGFNVTIPHKVSIMDLCDKIEDIARDIGSVNTVFVGDDDEIIGTNTDAFGFAENLKIAQPEFNFAAGPALVLGAGGAARAIICALKTLGISDIYITNRTKERAENLADKFGIKTVDWNEKEEFLCNINLLVNTTSLGMSGQKPLELSLDDLPENALVTDIVYKPLMTDLLQNAAANGHPVVTGIGMLLHQARPAFKAWFGVMPEIEPQFEQEILKAAA